MNTSRIYDVKKASTWTQAFPLGNGHLGAMCFSGADGYYMLSDNACYSGRPESDNIAPDAAEHMQAGIAYLAQGEYTLADVEFKHCISAKENYGTQVPLGHLFVALPEEASLQQRTLDLISGVHQEDFLIGEHKLTRTSFASHADRVLVVKVDAEGAMLPQLRIDCSGFSQPQKMLYKDGVLTVHGKALENIHSDGLSGVDYCIKCAIVTDGEMVDARGGVYLTNATKCEVYVTSHTSLFGEEFVAICADVIAKSCEKGYDVVYKQHVSEHSEGMGRCALQLPENENSHLPMPERLAAFRKDNTDLALVALFFQYGRYVIYDSSREDSCLPAALQGVWNDDRACRMGWTDDCHLDINTQMNYWPTSITNMKECEMPLLRFVKDILFPQGQKAAKALYGAEDAFMAHSITNAHGWAQPGWGGLSWSLFISGGAWIVTHVWEHYLYTRDEDFLKEYYPVLKATVNFYLAMSKIDESTGELKLMPTSSPENLFYFEGNPTCMCENSTVDITIMRYTLQAFVNACDALHCDDTLKEKAQYYAERLPAYQIGSKGQLLEWSHEFEEVTPDHRHTCHLLSMYPFKVLPQTEEMYAAVEKSLELRENAGGEDIFNANWAAALLVLYRSYLHDAPRAWTGVCRTIENLTQENGMVTHIGAPTSLEAGTYELDGNTGLTTGIANLLLHTQTKHMSAQNGVELEVLPAIVWEQGSVKGLLCHHGHTVDITWNANEVSVTLHCKDADEITLCYGKTNKELICTAGETIQFQFNR